MKTKPDDPALSESMRTVDSDEGRARTKAVLDAQPFPHFEPLDGRPDLVVKVDTDGTRTVGRFVDRVFQAGTFKEEDHAKKEK
jgi:hypothetical protein